MRGLPRISIVIPSFNKAGYIGKTLKSIAEQNYPNLEVIIQDPGSTDGSLKVINTYVKKYPRIFRLYKEKDSGQLDAINKGLNKSKGDILAYINADDVYEPGAFSAVGEYFTKNPKTLWLAGQGRVINKDDLEIAKAITGYKNILLKFNSYHLLLTTNYLIQPSVFLSRFAWKKYGPFRGVTKFVMEYEMWLRIGKDEMPSVLNKTLSSFRIPEKSFSRNEFEKTLSEDMRIVKNHTKNPFILFLHKIHNLGRTLVIKTV
jgi:glycosyltransferase involved in cell wall biosynthesis